MKREPEENSRSGCQSDSDTLESFSLTLRSGSVNEHRIEPFEEGVLMENLYLVNTSYDGNSPGVAESQRPVLGPLVVLLKRLAAKFTSWYIRPSIDRQKLFNAYVTRSLNEVKSYLDHLQINEDILGTIMHRDLALFRANLLYLNQCLERRMLDFESELASLRCRGAAGSGAEPEESPAAEPREVPTLASSLDVLTLEQRVHGSPRMARERQRIHLKYLRGCGNVLALGCGRGELLQLLARERIRAVGTETNGALVDYCRDAELEVSRGDSIEHLDGLQDGSVDGIVLSRFAGHQPPARLLQILGLCRGKLADGGVLIIETPNPFSLYAVASYALGDSNNGHPLHPETLKMLCLSYGFLEPEVLFLDPVPPEEQLEPIEPGAVGALMEPREQDLFREINDNFSKINRLLFSHRNYSLVARRSSRGVVE